MTTTKPRPTPRNVAAELRGRSVQVKVPATTANLGP